MIQSFRPIELDYYECTIGINQELNITKPTYSGDAVNAYNDGPLANGTQMGPFYEMESVSSAAFLKPGETLSHKHAVFHFIGDENDLDELSKKILYETKFILD